MNANIYIITYSKISISLSPRPRAINTSIGAKPNHKVQKINAFEYMRRRFDSVTKTYKRKDQVKADVVKRIVNAT